MKSLLARVPLFRVRHPRTVLDGVESVLRTFPGVTRPVGWGREGLIERCAKLVDITPDEFGRRVAESLNLPFARVTEPPDPMLLEEIGYSAEELEQFSVIPERCAEAPAGFRLIACYPEEVDRHAFLATGVTVSLGLSSDVFSAWDCFFGRAPGRGPVRTTPILAPSLIEVLLRVAVDCHRVGALEAFLGHPDAGCYECMTPEGRCAGRIHPRVLETLQGVLASGFPYEVTADRIERTVRNPELRSGGIRSFVLARTKSFDRPVIYLSWESSSEAASDGAESDVTATSIAKAAFTPSDTPSGTPAPVRSARVMVLDDDPRFSGILAAILRARGYEVLLRTDGEAAIAELREDPMLVDILICDVCMPHTDGGDVALELEKLDGAPPILMLTSDASPKREAELISRGIHGFVRKQDSPEILLAWVNNLRARRALRLAIRDRLPEVHDE